MAHHTAGLYRWAVCGAVTAAEARATRVFTPRLAGRVGHPHGHAHQRRAGPDAGQAQGEEVMESASAASSTSACSAASRFSRRSYVCGTTCSATAARSVACTTCGVCRRSRQGDSLRELCDVPSRPRSACWPAPPSASRRQQPPAPARLSLRAPPVALCVAQVVSRASGLLPHTHLLHSFQRLHARVGHVSQGCTANRVAEHRTLSHGERV